MKNKNKFSREGLIQACTDLRKNVDRDKIEFEQINMDATVLTRFENEIEDVKQVDQDGVIRDKIKGLTKKKNEARRGLHVEIQRSLLFIEAFLGNDSSLVGSLRGKGLKIKSDLHFINYAEGFMQLLNENSNKLEAIGLKTSVATDLSSRIEKLRELLSERKALSRLREIQTQERTALVDQLHASYVSICLLGKSIWYGIDATKINDYNVTISNLQKN